MDEGPCSAIRDSFASLVSILFVGKMFLSIEKVFTKISEDQLYMHCLCFSPYFLEKSVTFLLSYNVRNIVKQNWH